MGDTYQPIYDAIRSRIGGGNIGDAVRDAAHESFDISFAVSFLRDHIAQVVSEIRDEQVRPSVLFRPSLTRNGDRWHAKYGDDSCRSCSGSGDSPDEAIRAFDAAWVKKETKGENRP